MSTTDEKVQVSYSLATPAVPLTLIITYYKGPLDDTVEVVSATTPVLAIRSTDATDYFKPEEGSVHAVVLSDGDLTAHYAARSKEHEEKGYTKGWRRLCLTADIEKQRAEAEAEFRRVLLIRTKEDALREMESRRQQ
jgi:hypothetical protein